MVGASAKWYNDFIMETIGVEKMISMCVKEKFSSVAIQLKQWKLKFFGQKK